MNAAALSRTWLPFLAWWPSLTRDTLRSDAVAALTGAVVSYNFV